MRAETQPRFSLFAGDILWGLVARLGQGRPDRPDLRWVLPGMMLCLWGGLLVVVALESTIRDSDGLSAFLADWAAMAQFLVGLPILFAAEVHLDWRMRAAQEYLQSSGIVHQGDGQVLQDISTRAESLQRGWPNWLTWPLGVLFSWIWLSTEVSRGADAWYTWASGDRVVSSWAGIYTVIVPIGLLNAVWFRWGWKTAVWCHFLWGLSRLKLNLRPDHPDLMGGLGIVSWVQMGFAFALFGVASIMATTVGYNIAVKGMSPDTFAVWMPLVAFVAFAPLLFVTPLLFFTAPLIRAKQHGLTELGKIGVRYAERFDQGANAPITATPAFIDLGFQVGGLTALESAYRHVEHMRIVPFDLKSLSQLVLSSASPFLPLVVKYMPALRVLSSLSAGGEH